MNPGRQLPGPRARLPQASLVLLLAGTITLGSLGPWSSGSPIELAASDPEVCDTDRDGLPDRQEVVLGTDPLLPDSDFDGFLDGVEVAQQTDPNLFDDAPSGNELSVGMSARGEGGKLKVFTIVHLPDGQLDDEFLRFGVLIGTETVNLPLDRLAPHLTTHSLATPAGGALLTFDMEVPASLIENTGATTIFTLVGVSGQGRFARLAKVDLSFVKGVIALRMPYNPGSGGPGGVFEGATILRPIPPDGELGVPVDWEAGKVCFQLSEVVGTIGSSVVHQVVYAECESGWDTYCEPDCEATVQSTFITVDPGSLIGG